MRVCAGQILLIDWRGDSLPKEPNKLRPCVVIEDSDIFDPAYPNVIVVPMSQNPDFGIAGLLTEIAPSKSNGCPERCFLIASAVTSVSKRRIQQATSSHITPAQLELVRRQVLECIGML